MGFRFSKRISILPGVRINLSKSGASLSVGPRGASVTVGKRGTYANLGIPGTGLSYRERLDKPAGRQSQQRFNSGPEMPDNIIIEMHGDQVVLMRPEGSPLEMELIGRAKANLKEEIKDFLDQQAKDRNQAIDKLGQLHADIPFITSSLKGTSSGKPQPHDYPNSQAHIEALMRWRAEKANNGPDDDTVANGVLERLGALTWPAETNIAIQLSEGRLLLDVDLPEIEDMPNQTWKTLITKMAIEPRARSKKEIADSYIEHVSSVIVRLIGHAFSVAPEIKTVSLSAYTTRQTAIGGQGNECVATVSLNRSQWNTVNLAQIEQINPQQLLRHFGAAMATDTRGKLLVQRPLS